MATHRTVHMPGGEALVIDMQSRPDLLTGRHVHTCTVCYEHAPCAETCSIEPDLTLDDGTLRGAYSVCAACEEDMHR